MTVCCGPCTIKRLLPMTLTKDSVPAVIAIDEAGAMPEFVCAVCSFEFDRDAIMGHLGVSVNLLNTYNSTLAVVVRQSEFDGSVAPSTTPLSTGPATSPKSYVCCAIATAIFGVVNSRSHLSLFARYSNELDYLAKDLVVEMMKGRLPLTAQRRLVDVTVKRARKPRRWRRQSSGLSTREARKQYCQGSR